MKLNEVLNRATKGEWVALKHSSGAARDGSIIVAKEGAWGIGNMYSGGCRTSDEQDANAALACHAVKHLPKLVEALKFIANWEPTAGPQEPNGLSIMDAIDIARKALESAEEVDGI